LKLIISLASSAEVKIRGALPAVPEYLHDVVLNQAAFDPVICNYVVAVLFQRLVCFDFSLDK